MQGRYVEVSRREALAAPRTFFRHGGHYFLCESLIELVQREAIAKAAGARPRWYVWSDDLRRT